MWRRDSVSLSLKLLANSNHHHPLHYLRSCGSLPVFAVSSRCSSASASTSPAAADGIDAFSSTAGGLSPLNSAISLARRYTSCYWELSKARLSMLVVATSGTGYVLGSGSAVDLAGLCWTCAGTMMVAASANSLNQVFEIQNDSKMKRTRLRPLPTGRLTLRHAVTWASSVGLAGTVLLASKANMLAAGLAASNLILYAFVYTPLKQIHPVNTWVGAVVGAIPPLLGWAAASGQVSLNAAILPAALYFWQIPHFMALAYMCRNDYAAGGYKMLSLTDASGQRTALVALRNCLYLVPLGFLAYDWGVTSGWFCLESSLLTLAISASAYSFYRDPTMQKAKRMFHASLLYLPVFMTGLIIHRRHDNEQDLAEETELSSSLEAVDDQKTKARLKSARPPVAYASVAPFPFLPAPLYAGS
ncbi:protoheme IX farnesyltransferase, mitochondrial [Mercurialis annua]|uniref:protoheme IX farnesyltransferase, mitochondrial n=1 Tax=Mercurialis annua TaxID=3986 RepID=UPI00215F6CB3|nr:protoheme IX farnesyltransferase, mitochondrial [Mercurialis annua]XP_050221543.1 protoheme IX farnesyltransferase, mitochondrial [Mercurialis annua]XP_050221544.1 protoheme IX farnesyltransferase, mitochondrial [Mercurialis annua]